MKIYEDFDLTQYNSYRLKATCKKVYFPENENDLLSFFNEHDNFILLGSGHNVILSKPYYEQPVIVFNGNYNKIELVEKSILEIEAGAFMSDVAQFALENSHSGLEVFYDIPSSLGGAVVMNAGASGEEIKDVLMKVQYLDLDDLKVRVIAKENISFEYRNSFFQRSANKIVLKAWLKLKIARKKDIRKKMETLKSQRWAKQPKEYPNAGSVFKRPKGYYVGAMIEELGLKGYTIGGAKISEKHGGFIVNVNNAVGQDIIDLIEIVRSKVHARFGVWLEIEQRLIT